MGSEMCIRDRLMAEDIYVDTAPYAAEVENKKVIQLKIDRYPEE